MTAALTVFSAFTTRACGKAAWIRSPRLSSLQTERVGGIPCEKSSGLATSISVLPARFSAPAAARASSEAPPAVQLKTSSPAAAASAKVPPFPRAPASPTHSSRAALSGEREPIVTSCPSSTSFEPIVFPTVPVPRTAIRTIPSFARPLYCRAGEEWGTT